MTRRPVTGPSHHWDEVHTTRLATERSWYEAEPRTSLRLVQDLGVGLDVPIVDVGGGASALVDALLARGHTDVTVLDVSQQALDETRRRLGARAADVTFVCRDVLDWDADRAFAVWHDRAVLHFLTTEDQRRRYVERAVRATRPGSHLVVATFAPDGPTHCSGLEVARADADQLASWFSPRFAITHSERQEHTTPTGVVQPFTWVVLERR